MKDSRPVRGYSCLNHIGAILNDPRLVIHIQRRLFGALATFSPLYEILAACYDAGTDSHREQVLWLIGMGFSGVETTAKTPDIQPPARIWSSCRTGWHALNNQGQKPWE